MATRRDLLQSQRFLGQRVHSALVIHETDPEQPPFRRPALAAWGSIGLAVLALVAVGAYGYFRPGGNTAWRDGNAVIVVKETGARYVYVDQRLHPVLNYTSALLALGRNAPTRTISRESLTGVARGPAIGIPDVPDTLPAKKRLLTGGWSLCSSGTQSVLLAGAEPAGARALDDRALLVEVPETGDQYLIWRGHQHRIRRPDTVTVGLALRTEPLAKVGSALVDLLPHGDPIAPLPVRDAGRPSRAVPGRADLLTGQLLVSGTGENYLVEADRLRAITALQSEIQLAAAATATAYPGNEPVPIPVGVSAVAAAAVDERITSPATRPTFAAVSGPVCVTYDDGAAVPRVQLGGALPAATVPTAGRTAEGLPLAGRVHVPPGRAAIAQVVPHTLVLVTDQGRAYPLAGPDVLDILGYAGARPVRLPASLVSRVPLGAGLDPAHARDPVQVP